MLERSYAFTRGFPGVDVATVAERTRAALTKEGFGVLTEIDVSATLKQKLGIEQKPYLILGACNPSLAHRALRVDPGIGVFLPCNVTVFEGDDGTTYVQAINPEAMFQSIREPAIKPISDEVATRLQRVVASL